MRDDGDGYVYAEFHPKETDGGLHYHVSLEQRDTQIQRALKELGSRGFLDFFRTGL